MDNKKRIAKQESKKEEILKKYAQLVKRLKRIPKQLEIISTGVISDKNIAYYFSNISTLTKEAEKKYPECFKNILNIKEVKKEETIKKKYAQLVKRLKKYPTTIELVNNKLSQVTITYHFKDREELKEVAEKKYPECFKGIVDYEIWNNERFAETKSAILNSNKFVITTAVIDAPVDKKFLKSIDTFCKINKYELLILLADNELGKLDENIENRNIIFKDVKLNSNLFLSTIKLKAKQIDPLTGLDRITKGSGSVILASPKQRLRYNPNLGNLPKCEMTTGAITFPSYKGKRYEQLRTDYLATEEHKMGAVVIEIENNKLFHFRHIQADKSGGFNLFGTYYNEDKIEKIPPSATVYGDWHSGDTDPIVSKCWENLAKETNCKTLVLHDSFNGTSISHHDQNNITIRAQKAKEGHLSLEKEIIYYAKDLNDLANIYETIIIVKSNHDQHLERYLQEARYAQDSYNHRYALDLAIQHIEGNDPLKWATEKYLKNPEKFIWLKEDQQYRIEGIDIGTHGHRGINGSRGGSLKSLEKTGYKMIVGHSHTPEILREIMRVGTSTHLRLPYNKGPSSWFNTSALIYPGGARALIVSSFLTSFILRIFLKHSGYFFSASLVNVDILLK